MNTCVAWQGVCGATVVVERWKFAEAKAIDPLPFFYELIRSEQMSECERGYSCADNLHSNIHKQARQFLAKRKDTTLC